MLPSRLCLSLLISMLSYSFFAPAQTQSNASKPEEQVMQLERDWLAADAKGDRAWLGRIVADDFVGSTFDGGVLSKQDIIPQGGGPGGFAGASPSENTVRIFGDTAVLMGFIKTEDRAQTQQTHVTLVCQKRGQIWQIIAAQLTHM
jgi:hypothetical protein